MNKGQYVFSQILSLASSTSFRTCVNRYNGNYKAKHFTCWKQFLCMVFGQLTQRESLRDTMLCLTANADKLYHLGIGEAVSHSTLSTANENRDWQIYADFAMVLIAEAKQLYVDEQGELELNNQVFAIDATVIDLCLSVFSWAKFRTTKGAIKLHTQLNVKTAIPEFIHVTTGNVHEVNVLDRICFQQDSFYVLDRGYTDFKKLFQIHKAGAYFIIRAKDNLNFTRIKSDTTAKSDQVLCDQVIRLTNYYASHDYPQHLRRIKFFDAGTQKTFVFLSNNFTLKSTEIATLYRHRWKIELFFKWIKQHLKIKSFWGTSSNAVKTQIWIAISTYVLVAIAKKKFNLKQSLYEILQVLSISIFDKAPLPTLFEKPTQQNVNELFSSNQLNIFE
ncbi:MAG: IS4 family transposase [Cytophagales bacterium]